VIIHDLDLVGVSVSPAKTQAPLIIDANAVLTCSLTLQRFQAIAWRGRQIAEGNRGIELPQLSLRDPLDGPKTRNPLPLMEPLCVLRPEALIIVRKLLY
jgi:hypothetical protein